MRVNAASAGARLVEHDTVPREVRCAEFRLGVNKIV